MERSPERAGVKASGTTFRIVGFLHEQGSATLDEVATGVGVSTSTAHRHLTTLHENEYVVTDDGEYQLALHFLTLGGKVRTRIPNHELIDTKVKQITEETSERAQFIVEEHGERVYVFTHAGPNAVKTDATIGKTGPLHVSAAGKSIMASMSESRLDEVLGDGPLEATTPNSITDPDALRSELDEIREQGYGFNDEESTPGLRAVGVPVHHDDGRVIGAISISGPANRLKGSYFREELPDLLLGSVNEIELNLKYS